MKKLMICLVMLHSGLTFAGLDKDQEQGLKDTQHLLKSRSERNAFIKTDKNAKAADDRLESLTGSGANKDEVYGISSDVMEKLTRSTNGDPVKMQQILDEAAKNPEAFYNKYFDESSKARVRGVAGKVNSPGVQAPR